MHLPGAGWQAGGNGSAIGSRGVSPSVCVSLASAGILSYSYSYSTTLDSGLAIPPLSRLDSPCLALSLTGTC